MIYILLTALAVVAVYAFWALSQGVQAYFKFRGQRLVSCPETHRPAAVRVAAAKVGLEAMAGKEHLELSQCSRWPERQDCPQDCLAQIEEAPRACLVWTIINQWYEGQECVYCHKPFAKIHWHDHPPALLDANRRTLEWDQVPPEHLQEMLGTSWPVCWSCHMAQTFRRQHPELVVDRPVH